MGRIILYGLAIFLLSTFNVWGQHHFFRQYSLEDGLPQSEVNDIAEDKFGYLWLGTNGGGLCRFNGVDFEVLTKKDGLQEDIVMGLHSDNNYDLWICSQRGISKYDGINFHHYIQSDTTLFQDRTQFLETVDGSVWALVREVSGIRKIYRFFNDSLTDFTTEHSEIFKDNNIFFMTNAGPKQIYVSTNNGIYKIEGDSIQKINFIGDFDLSNGMYISILQDKFRNTWLLSFTSDNSVKLLQVKFTGEVLEMDWPKNIPLQRIFRVYEDRSGDVWIAVATHGIVRFSDRKIKIYNKSNGLKASIITSLWQDREGNMWFGSSGSGLLKYGGDKFVAFNRESGLSGDIVRIIFEDHKGDIYFGDDNNMISVYDGKSIEPVDPSNNLNMGQARGIIELPDNNLLIGTLSGAYEYDHKKIVNVSEKYGLNQQSPIIALFEDKDNYWFGVYGRGLLKYNKEEGKKWYRPDNSTLKSPFITDIFKDSKDRMWISTTNGVFVLQDTTFTHYSDKDHLNAAWVLQCAEDKTGNIWLATFTGGLNRFDGEKFTYYDTTQGVKSDNIYSVIADTEGNIWAGTQNGVDKITIGADGEVSSIRNFDKDDGFIGIENNGGCNLLDSKGRIWFGTIKGAMMYNPDEEKKNYLEPPVYIKNVLLNFKNPNWSELSPVVKYDSLFPWFLIPENLKLPHNRNHVAFVFDGLCYTVPEKTKYKWKLEPIEQEWSPENTLNKAFYPSLPPGNYTFKVIASNNDEIWNEEGTSYSFEIVPAWYQYAFIKVIGFILVIGLVIYLVRQRIQKERLLKTALETRLSIKKIEIQKQQSEIQRKNELLETQKSQLQTQAESLKSANVNLERLTQIGQLVTANLSVDKISELLHQSVSKVMSTGVFSVGLYNDQDKSIDFTYSYLHGERQPFIRYLVEDKERLAIYCFTHNQAVFVNDFYNEYQKYLNEIRPVPEGAESQSIIYIPLRTSKEVIGVISVQSLKKNAYTNYHLNFLQNIAIYASIAISNALKYQDLVYQQRELKNIHENVVGEKDLLNIKKQQLENLNNEKNQLISLFVKGIQEPLNLAIGELGEFIASQQNCSDTQKEFITDILQILNKQNEVVNNVLEIHNIEMDFYEYQPQKIDVREVLVDIIEKLNDDAFKKDVSIKLNAKDSIIDIDLSLFIRIFENLISNAIKFSPEKADVWVVSSIVNNAIRLEVRDQGPGLTDDEQSKIFEKYSQFDKGENQDIISSGLGLYIVYKYVTKMNGSVRCQSIEGVGTTFIVEFPLT